MAFHNIPPNGFPDIPDMEELEAVVKDVTTLKTSVVGLASDVSNLSSSKANQITIAPFFNAETAYEVGDLVYYNGLSYRCTNNHEGEWDADDFAATTIANELDTLKSGLTNLENGTKTLLGKLEVSESVQLPAQYKQLYLRVNITDWFNGSINVIDGARILIPFSVSAWSCTIQLEISNNEITFVSETTVAGTKDSAWTTYVEIYYS